MPDDATLTAAGTAGTDVEAQDTQTDSAVDQSAEVGGQETGVQFTQEQLDTIIKDRLGRQENSLSRKFEDRLQSELARVSQQYNLGRQTEEETMDPEEARYFELRKEVELVKINSEIDQLSRKYPDFAENEETVINLALQLGTKDLEVAYQVWKFPQLSSINVKALEERAAKRAIADYLKNKGETAETLPQPEGTGGSAPVAPAKSIKSFDDAEKAHHEVVRMSRPHRG